MTYKFVPSLESEYVDRYLSWRKRSDTDAPLEYAEMLALGTLSVAAGAQLTFRVNQFPRPYACTLFMLLLGESTVYRKSGALGTADYLLNEAFRGAQIEEPASWQAFVQGLQARQSGGGWLKYDEFAWPLDRMKKEGGPLSALKSVLLRCWDNDLISNRRTNKEGQPDQDFVEFPVLTLLAASTPVRLAMIADRADFEDGFFPRFLTRWPQEHPKLKPLSRFNPHTPKLYNRIRDDLVKARERVSGGVELALSDDAWNAADEAQTKLNSKIEKAPDFGAIYGRAELYRLRIAGLLGLADDLDGDGDVPVEETHIGQADALLTRCLEDGIRLMRHAASNKFEGDLQKMMRRLKVLSDSGKRASLRDMHRAVPGIKASEMSQFEKTALERQYITVEEGRWCIHRWNTNMA